MLYCIILRGINKRTLFRIHTNQRILFPSPRPSPRCSDPPNNHNTSTPLHHPLPARRHEAGKRNLYFRNKAGRQDGKPLSDWNSDVLYHFDDWSNHCEQPLAIPADFPSSGSVAPDTKTNAKKDLPTLLDMPCLRPALAHGRERS